MVTADEDSGGQTTLDNSKKVKRKRRSISIPVTCEPGYPQGFGLEDLEFPGEAWLLSYLSNVRGSLSRLPLDAKRVLEAIEKMVAAGNRPEVLHDETPVCFREVIRVCEGLDESLEQLDPVRAILSFNRDVLGIYRIDKPSIEIYWGICGLVAQLLGVSVESIAAIVLAHELAHGYTHAGFDIDGKSWDSVRFAEAEKALVEGLAQYYTHRVVEISGSFAVPDIVTAYEELVRRQPWEYQTHLRWVRPGLIGWCPANHTRALDGGASPEEIRLALLEVRRGAEGSGGELARFDSALVRARRELGGKPGVR